MSLFHSFSNEGFEIGVDFFPKLDSDSDDATSVGGYRTDPQPSPAHDAPTLS
jgi:hypothetical protein